MSEWKVVKEKKICGWCAEEIVDDKYVMVWNATENKPVGTFCRKCYNEDKKLIGHIRKMLS